MKYRTLGKTGYRISEVSLGTWQVGGRWGEKFDEKNALDIINRAIDLGINFIDTADVYGDGHSERLVARLRRERPGETIHVATKAGRRLPIQTPDGYTRENLTAWVERSLRNLETEALDLLQLHCPHPGVFDRPDVFGVLDDLVKGGKVRHYGASVETCGEALAAMRHPNVRTIQIIFNLFRLKPAAEVFPAARARQVGVLARVPLASGLLTGRLRPDSVFAPDDHRAFNRHGEAFDQGETFSGVPYDVGLEAVERLRPLVPAGESLAQLALRWVLMFDAVSCTIPGARTERQARENAAASKLPALDGRVMEEVQTIYDEMIRPHVHARW
jgi:aryl-alcohol dehydrogenase-like predicted oxidoreductase